MQPDPYPKRLFPEHCKRILMLKVSFGFFFARLSMRKVENVIGLLFSIKSKELKGVWGENFRDHFSAVWLIFHKDSISCDERDFTNVHFSYISSHKMWRTCLKVQPKILNGAKFKYHKRRPTLIPPTLQLHLVLRITPYSVCKPPTWGDH